MVRIPKRYASWHSHFAPAFTQPSPISFVKETKCRVDSFEKDTKLLQSLQIDTSTWSALGLKSLYSSLNFLDPAALKLFYKEKQIPRPLQLIHSLLNIEYNAVISYMIIPMLYQEVQELPPEFIVQLSSIVKDESRHFLMLEDLLKSEGFEFGDFPVNNNILKDLETTSCLLDHICMVSLTHEGKGIDAGPRLLQSIKHLPDKRIYNAVKLIVDEEESHVSFGVEWYNYLCNKAKLNPDEHYKQFLERHGFKVFNPNTETRNKIGFTFY